MTTKTATKPAPVAAPAPVTDADLEALRKRWMAADKGEGDARKLFEAAGIAWENARVIKVRVAYAAAMIAPVKGEANLLNATRILLTDPADTPAKRTATAKGKKSTLRNYVAAGEALAAKGLATRITEPDEEERKIVDAVFKEANRAKKAQDKADKAATSGEGEGEGGAPGTPADDEAVGYVHLVGYVAQMNRVLDMIAAGGVVVSETEASNMADMLHAFQLKLSAYAADK